MRHTQGTANSVRNVIVVNVTCWTTTKSTTPGKEGVCLLKTQAVFPYAADPFAIETALATPRSAGLTTESADNRRPS